jgi:hypothetical protein
VKKYLLEKILKKFQIILKEIINIYI